MSSQTRIDDGGSREKAIRYDFWSLVNALESGLTHGGATPGERAKKIVASMGAIQPAERQAILRTLGNVVTYLSAIEREAEGGSRSAAGKETVELNSFVRLPADKSQ
jgi:hypothetical protein